MVLAYHLFALNSRYYQDLLPDFFYTGTLGVDIFFILSGYVMALITHKASPGYLTVRSFIIKRGLRIYPIYWLYTSLVLLIYAINPNIVNSSYTENPSILRSFLLLPDFSAPWLNVGWTLVYEIYFYFLISILLFFKLKIRNYFLLFYFIFLIFYNFNYYYSLNPNNPFKEYYLSPLVCEFILGYWLFFKQYNKNTSVNSAGLFLSLTFMITSSYWIDIDSNFKRLIIFGFPSLMFVYCFMSIFSEKRNFNFFKTLGDISFSTYLSHVLVLNAVGVVFRFLEINGLIGSILCLFFSILSVYAWSYISFHFFEKRILSYASK
tara:strand:- start:1081 stop:2043 length:963 start_codon:yes stop_codon:yes gene_type:complete